MKKNNRCCYAGRKQKTHTAAIKLIAGAIKTWCFLVIMCLSGVKSQANTFRTFNAIRIYLPSRQIGLEWRKESIKAVLPDCSNTLSNCNPTVPLLLTRHLTAWINDTFRTLETSVIGIATVEWFTGSSGGLPVFTGLNCKPSGSATMSETVFYAQARSTDPTYPRAASAGREKVNIRAEHCIKEVDLALKKTTHSRVNQLSDPLTYTLKVWNESNNNATGVEVLDNISTTVEFQAGSFVVSRGNASIKNNVIQWVIGNIAAGGDTVSLTYRVKALQDGVHFNTAEISKTNEKDIDSTPGNTNDTEDDIERQCFTVPIKLCSDESVEVNVLPTYMNVQWFKAGSSTSFATGNAVLLSEPGTYTYTATNQTCPAGGCCPIIIEPDNTCPQGELSSKGKLKKEKK